MTIRALIVQHEDPTPPGLVTEWLDHHGADVYRSDTSEIGWLPVRSKDPDLVPDGPWFQWHFDTFTLPPGATLIAESDAGPQAFLAGRSLGLQFHPEVTTQIMDDWVRVYRHELDADGVDPDGLLEETKQLALEARRNAWQLLERFLHEVAKAAPDHVRSDATGRAG